MRRFYALVDKAEKLINWNIDDTVVSVLSCLYPLRRGKKAIDFYIPTRGSQIQIFHHISVGNMMRVYLDAESSGKKIDKDDIKTILPFSDAIVDAVVTRKDEVRRLLNLRREFVDIPDSVRASDFIDIKRFNYLDSDYKGNPVMRNIGDIKLLIPTINRIWIDFVPNRSYNKYNKPEFSLNYAFMSKDWLFVLENYDVLMELFTKILDWYPKTYQKQLKIRNAILSIEKTVKMEGKLLE